jgi:hypothetical protein
MQTLEKINFRQTRDMGDVITTTFTFIKKEFKPLFNALLKVSVPMIVVTGILNGLYQVVQRSNPGSAEMVGVVFLMLISAMVCVSAMVSTVYHYILIYMERGEGNIEAGEVWNRAKKDVGMLVVTAIASGFLIGFGSVLLFIPGIYLMVTLSLINNVRVQERLGFTDAFKRCRELIKGEWWSTLGLLLVVYLIISVFSLIFAIPAGVVGIFEMLHTLNPEEYRGTPGGNITIMITATITAIGTYLLYVPLFIAIALQYYNLVEKKEASGLLDRLQHIGVAGEKADDREDY